VTSHDKLDQRKSGRPKQSRPGTVEAAARRHQGRMLALQVLYELDLTNHDAGEAMARAFAEHDPVSDDVVAHVQALVSGVLAQREQIDPMIAAAAPARALEEQAAIERNVLRLAAYELLYAPDVPPKVVINEGVELAKRFGGENSSKFINGVLRTLYNNRQDTSAEPTM
jgi:N utilization substance protein B